MDYGAGAVGGEYSGSGAAAARTQPVHTEATYLEEVVQGQGGWVGM